MVRDNTEKVELTKKRKLGAQNQQKSYMDIKRKYVQLVIGDLIYLKISPMMGMMGFGF